jgi:hypothetical protein
VSVVRKTSWCLLAIAAACVVVLAFCAGQRAPRRRAAPVAAPAALPPTTTAEPLPGLTGLVVLPGEDVVRRTYEVLYGADR